RSSGTTIPGSTTSSSSGSTGRASGVDSAAMIVPSAVKLSYTDSMLVSLRMFPKLCSLRAIDAGRRGARSGAGRRSTRGTGPSPERGKRPPRTDGGACQDERMSTPYDIPDAPEVLDRREGPYGEVVLRRHGGLLQIIANGCFLMDTSDGRSERRLVDAALAELDAADRRAGDEPRPAPHVLIGGLGVGFSLAHAAADPRWGRITVVEREPAVIDWHRTGPLGTLSAEALADPRTEIVEADLITYVNET